MNKKLEDRYWMLDEDEKMLPKIIKEHKRKVRLNFYNKHGYLPERLDNREISLNEYEYLRGNNTDEAFTGFIL